MKKNILGTNKVTQIGIIVKNIEETAQAYADLFGVEKPEIGITAHYDIAKTKYLGNDTKARAKQAFFNIGEGIEIELLEPDDEPSTWRHDLDTYGEGIHHIAFNVKGINEIVDALEQKGFKEIQKGEWDGGRYSYLDARDKLKLIIELLEFDD